ncbi:hypothetical protein [Halobaculum rubrum]|uniref:hypothetical protein n=1 Tax=Halobaculum rubrum TaxID=2872158 RepID=UPI001CA3FA1D|nr:hypothetical protein [Halobaculum rubrum]QZY00260.1 hypothetical protein K6T25_03930 [Halobaculum rubrum]
MPLDRRSFLATTATLAATATGGCTGCAASPTASLRMTAEDDAGLAREALYTFGDSGTEGGADPEPSDDLAVRVVDEDPVTTEDTHAPLPTDRPVVVNDGVYRFAAETVDSRELRSFSVTINPIRVDEGEETPGPNDRIRYGDLPEVDRAVLAERGYDDERPIGIGTSLSYRPEAVEESVLVPELEYPVVVWPDGPARFEVDGASTYTVYTYELTAERVASAAAFGADLRERFGFSLAVLPREEREILDAAIDPETPAPDGDDYSGYHVASDEEPSEALRSLVDRFRERDPVVLEWEHDPESRRASGEYVVRYDGTVYWASLQVDESAFTETPTTEG